MREIAEVCRTEYCPPEVCSAAVTQVEQKVLDGMGAPRLLFVVTEDWYFCSHRLHLAKAALRHGFEVAVATRFSQFRERIQDEGLSVVSLELPRGVSDPFPELGDLSQVTRLYHQSQPDLVHHVAMKAVLYGSLAAARSSLPAVVNAITGLGHVFAEDGWKCRLLRAVIRRGLRLGLDLPNACVIFQNNDDRDQLVGDGVVPASQSVVICSAGVDVQKFQPTSFPTWHRTSAEGAIVLLPSRMLWTKGVGDFVEAARLLRDSGSRARFALVGRVDTANPGHIAERQLHDWDRSGVVEWWGHQEDMPGALSRASIVVLPTVYREGVPKVLIEAAASARPVVTTNMPGCRDVVQDGVTGILVGVRNAPALADAIQSLLENRSACIQMGIRGRQRVVQNFSTQIVADQTLKLYDRLLDSAGRTDRARRRAA